MIDGLWNALVNAAGDLFDSALGVGSLSGLKPVLTLSSNSGSFDFSFLWTVVTTILKATTSVGYGLIVVFFLWHMFNSASRDNVTVESTVKSMIMLIISVAFIGNIPTIVNTFLAINDSVINDSVMNQTTADGNVAAINGRLVARSLYNNGSSIPSLFVMAAIMWLLHWVAIIAIYFAAIGRALEIGWKSALAPIACSNMFDGSNSSGMRHMKGLAAACLAGFAIYATATVGFALSASFLTTTASNTVTETETTANNAYTQSSYFGFIQSAPTYDSSADDIKDIDENQVEGSFMIAIAAQLATAGACIGVNNKVSSLL